MSKSFLLPLLLTAAGVVAAEERPPLLTGEVFSRKAQEIIVPLTTNWQARISKMVPEGAFLETGQLAVEFDGTEAARQLEQRREAARAEQAKTRRDLARLEKETAQAGFLLQQARVTVDLATLKADIPEGLIGSLEHSENQLAKEKSIKALEDAENQLADKQKSLAERREQAEMDARKTEIQEQWWAQMLDSFRIHARQSGYILYKNHPWTRAKFQEGDTVRTSFKIAQIADTTDLAVKVWINSVDKPRVTNGVAERVIFDALPNQVFSGVLENVSDSGNKRQEWGDGIYFEGVVTLDQAVGAALLPGMSALVEVSP